MKYLFSSLFAIIILTPVNYAKPLLIGELPSSQVFDFKQYKQEILELSEEDFNNAKVLTNLQEDYLLYQKISTYSDQTLSVLEIEHLKSLSDYIPKAYRKHSEGPIAIPFFDIASLAKSKLHQYQVNEVYLQLRNSYEVQSSSIHDLIKKDIGSIEKKALIKFFERIDVGSLNSLVNSFIADFEPSLVLFDLVATASSRTQRFEHYAYLFKHSDSPQSVKLVKTVSKVFTNSEAIKLLKFCLENNSGLASQALIELGKLNSPSEYFISKLNNPSLGPTAAMVLAKRIEKEGELLLNELNSLALNSERDQRTQVANIILVYKLSNIDLNSEHFKNLLSHIPQQDIKEEAQSWLH